MPSCDSAATRTSLSAIHNIHLWQKGIDVWERGRGEPAYGVTESQASSMLWWFVSMFSVIMGSVQWETSPESCAVRKETWMVWLFLQCCPWLLVGKMGGTVCSPVRTCSGWKQSVIITHEAPMCNRWNHLLSTKRSCRCKFAVITKRKRRLYLWGFKQRWVFFRKIICSHKKPEK